MPGAVAASTRPAPAGDLPAPASSWRSEAGRAAVGGVVAALVVYLGFDNGGYFAGATALAAMVLCGALAVRFAASRSPAAGLGPLGLVAGGALACFAAWTLLSAGWSDAPARALLEFDRVLAYVLAFALLALVPRGGATGSGTLRWLLRWLAAAFILLTLAALAVRLRPDLGEVALGRFPDRMSWPLGYWNALGLMAAMGLLLALWLTADVRETWATRLAAATVLPALAVATYLTLSRGAIAAAAVGVVLFLVLARGPGLPGALLATVPFVVLGVLDAYDAQALTDGFSPDRPESVQQGRDVAGQLLLWSLGALAARAALLALDARLGRLRVAVPSLRVRAAIAVATLALLGGGVLAFDAPAAAERAWSGFAEDADIRSSGSRERLASINANGRIAHWEVALDAWRDEPLRGTGAGTYAKRWALERPYFVEVQNGHSLYAEVLGELGAVGGALLLVAIGTGAVAMFLRRREDRVAWSAAIAVLATWAVRAGLDWDWEMPAITLGVVALLGCACARREAPPASRRARVPLRVLAVAGLALLAITPFQVNRSQRHIDRSLAAFQARDCDTAAAEALKAVEVLGSRPEPFELLGYCEVRRGRPELGVPLLRAALARDPGTWELYYGLSLVRGAAGQDPRPALASARRVNPLDPRIRELTETLGEVGRRSWRRVALRAPLIIPPAERGSGAQSRD